MKQDRLLKVFNQTNPRTAPLRAASWRDTLPAVTSDDLDPQQAARLTATAARQLRFLNHLCARMNRLGFPPADPLFIAAHKARNALQDLHVLSHYAECKHGVGKPSPK